MNGLTLDDAIILCPSMDMIHAFIGVINLLIETCECTIRNLYPLVNEEYVQRCDSVNLWPKQ